jgi:hypothetical protein
MTLPITVAIATILILIVGVMLLVSRLGSEKRVLPVTTEWLSELSTDRYRPMQRLLEEVDFQFLRSQKGFTPEVANRLRRQRVQVFRGYLHLLEADFDRVSAALRLILAQSECDRPELASLLFQRRMSFAFALLGVHCRLLLFRWGLSGVDVSSVLQLFDGMRRELRSLVPDSSPAVA